jgi:hypothetical protein
MEKLWAIAKERMPEYPDCGDSISEVLGYSRHDNLYEEVRPEEIQKRNILPPANTIRQIIPTSHSNVWINNPKYVDLTKKIPVDKYRKKVPINSDSDSDAESNSSASDVDDNDEDDKNDRNIFGSNNDKRSQGPFTLALSPDESFEQISKRLSLESIKSLSDQKKDKPRRSNRIIVSDSESDNDEGYKSCNENVNEDNDNYNDNNDNNDDNEQELLADEIVTNISKLNLKEIDDDWADVEANHSFITTIKKQSNKNRSFIVDSDDDDEDEDDDNSNEDGVVERIKKRVINIDDDEEEALEVADGLVEDNISNKEVIDTNTDNINENGEETNESENFNEHELSDDVTNHELSDDLNDHELSDDLNDHELSDDTKEHELSDNTKEHELSDNIETDDDFVHKVNKAEDNDDNDNDCANYDIEKVNGVAERDFDIHINNDNSLKTNDNIDFTYDDGKNYNELNCEVNNKEVQESDKENSMCRENDDRCIEHLSFDHFKKVKVPLIGINRNAVDKNSASYMATVTAADKYQNIIFKVNNTKANLSESSVQDYNSYILQAQAAERRKDRPEALACYAAAMSVCDEDILLHGKIAYSYNKFI